MLTRAQIADRAQAGLIDTETLFCEMYEELSLLALTLTEHLDEGPVDSGIWSEHKVLIRSMLARIEATKVNMPETFRPGDRVSVIGQGCGVPNFLVGAAGHIVTMHRGRGRRSNIWYARVRFDASTKPHSVCLLDLRRL